MMAVRVGKTVLHDWRSLELSGGFTDTFVFRLSPLAGIPPNDYGKVIRRIVMPVFKLRRSASLWVQVCSGIEPGVWMEGAPVGEGRWYREAIQRALRGLPLPVAVTHGEKMPEGRDFSFRPWTDIRPSPRPPRAEPLFDPECLPFAQLSSLRGLGRLNQGFTSEIASLSLQQKDAARAALNELLLSGHVQYDDSGKYPVWWINRSGTSLALRSWGIPAGVSFPERKERGYALGRHRHTARLWPAWVKAAWPEAEVWAGWSEVALGRLHPDGLAWGRLLGRETLFWLEVERGKASKDELRRRYRRRFNRALVYIRSFKLPFVFTVLGPGWVRETLVTEFRNVPPDAVVVLGDWLNFGGLPRLG